MARFKWTVEIEVDETWVEDGFNLHQERADDMADGMIAHAYSGEVSWRVISSPDPEEVAKVQGYDSAAEMLKADQRDGIRS